MATAVVVVHGIGPHDRYEIEDQFAQGLFDARKRDAPASDWQMSLQWPSVARPNARIEEIGATALRVCRVGGGDAVDVYEGYWSPIDKGKASVIGTLQWLLRACFTPFGNSRIPATLGKFLYDLAFLVVALAIALAAAIGCVVAIYAAARQFSVHLLDTRSIVSLVIGLLGAYAVAHTLARALALLFEWLSPHAISVREKMHEQAPPQGTIAAPWGSVGYVVVLAGGVVALLLSISELARFNVQLHRLLPLLAAALLARYVVAFARGFLVGAVGDIQIFSTHDENGAFYALREEIIATVGDVVLQVLRARDAAGAPAYERIVLAGHSLGSTILLDTILRLRDLTLEGGIANDDWQRIAAFVTFGAAVEKTRFFFAQSSPILSDRMAAAVETRERTLFTAQPVSDNAPTIYWLNLWYFTDVVANAIVSFDAQNLMLPAPRSIFPHNHYLFDANFWKGIRGICLSS